MRAVLFDFNGTLFDDTRFHLRAWQRYMRRKFGIELTLEEVRRDFIGPNNSTIFHNYFGDRFSDAQLHAFSREKEEEYRAAARAEGRLQLMEGAPELFDLLTERGVPFALATASEMDNVRFYLNDLGLDRWFTMDRIVYDQGLLASKPDPAFYLEAARRLSVRPEDCVVAEDSPSGIQAAASAKAGRIIAIDRTAPREWLEANGDIYAIVHDFWGFERFI